ncbi:MAG: hypothetical protein HY921_04325 [Elusimicrobia bacterium]|nr:hypothetical protein [Elusimicrobiota bacterium]
MTVFILDTAGDKGFVENLGLFEKRILSPEEFPAGTSSGLKVLIEAQNPETFAGGLRQVQRLGKIRLLIVYSHMGPGRIKMNGEGIETPFFEDFINPQRLADQARIVFAGCEFTKGRTGLRAMEFLGYKWLSGVGGSLGAFDRYSVNDQDSPVGTSSDPDDPARLRLKADQTGATVHDDFQKHFIRFSMARLGRNGVFELGGAKRVVLPPERKKCAEGKTFAEWIACIEGLAPRLMNLNPAAAR